MILAIDSSVGTVVGLITETGQPLARREVTDRRSHAEAIGPLIHEALESAAARPADVTAVVMGVGPGPFTGLRVGIAAAQAFAWARGVPLWPVRSHDGLAWDLREPSLVVSDVRRGEWAVTAYQPGSPGESARRDGQTRLIPRDQITRGETHLGNLRLVWMDRVDPVALALVAMDKRRRGESLEPARPLYLRGPDVTLPT